MPIGPILPGCIAICAPEAGDVRQEVPRFNGVIRFSSDRVSLSDVAIKQRTVTGVSFTEISSRACFRGDR